MSRVLLIAGSAFIIAAVVIGLVVPPNLTIVPDEQITILSASGPNALSVPHSLAGGPLILIIDFTPELPSDVTAANFDAISLSGLRMIPSGGSIDATLSLGLYPFGGTDIHKTYTTQTTGFDGSFKPISPTSGVPVPVEDGERYRLKLTFSGSGVVEVEILTMGQDPTIGSPDFTKNGVAVGPFAVEFLAEVVSVYTPPDDGVDTDGDGLPDDWEMDNFGNLDQTAADDFDGDGYTNGEEHLVGTDPADPKSCGGCPPSDDRFRNLLLTIIISAVLFAVGLGLAMRATVMKEQRGVMAALVGVVGFGVWFLVMLMMWVMV